MTTVGVLELSSFFSSQPSLFKVSCSKKPDSMHYSEGYVQCDSYVLCLFDNGPLTMLRLFEGNAHQHDLHTLGFTADFLIQQYLKINNAEKAINVLLCLNWDVYGSVLITALHKIASYIFKQIFKPERELQLQKALGSFLIPVKPLCEETQIEFGDQIRDLTRKFFQYLLRNQSYEKAFNLAIDIDDENIFMDLSNCAKDDGLLVLAHDAFRNAEAIFIRSDSRQSNINYDSECSHDSCSDYSHEVSADDESDVGIGIFCSQNRLNTAPNISQSKVKNTRHRNEYKRSVVPDSDIRIPKPELKVSNFSKSSVNCDNRKNKGILNHSSMEITIPRGKNEFDFRLNKMEAKHNADDNNSKLNTNNCSAAPQRHHVVDVVPKPQQSRHWRDLPVQTLGIPVLSPSMRSNIFCSSQQSKSMQNIARIFPPIILHPMVSGNIPLSGNRKIVPLDTLPHQITNFKKETGEKNKVKFSNTVQVAVVPVS